MAFPTSGCISYYKLDDTSNVNQVDSVGGLTLTNNGSITWLPWKIGNASALNGVTQYLSQTSDYGLSGVLQNYSFSGWFQPSSTIVAQTTFFNHTSSVNHDDVYFEWLSSNARVVRTRLWWGSDIASVAQTFSASTWYHIVVTYDGSTVSWYINNGSAFTVASTLDGTVWWTSWFALWATKWGGMYFPWLVDEFGIWNRALSSGEVSDLYNGWAWITYPTTSTNSGFFFLM